MTDTRRLTSPNASNLIASYTGGDASMIDKVLEAVLLFIRSLLSIVIGSIKALMPNGVLPRKNARGEVVLITGSGSGLGRLMAIEFAKLGAKLVLWDMNEKGNKETKKLVEERGAQAFAYTVDISKNTNIYAAADEVKKDVGNVNILINNAGIVTGKKLFDCPDELMEKTMAVNTNSLFYTAKAFLPAMMETNHGHVVTIASMAGKVGTAGLVDYCASKHGAVGFHESLTAELFAQGKTGVHTTVVCPYYIDTGMFDGVQTKAPNLLPILQPEYVVDCILEAILTNRSMLALPKFSYIVNFGASFLPSDVLALFSDYLGVHETMETFKGRAKAH